jgi:hypothetical protein
LSSITGKWKKLAERKAEKCRAVAIGFEELLDTFTVLNYRRHSRFFIAPVARYGLSEESLSKRDS